MKNIYLQLLDHQTDIFRTALATVTGTMGSTPQKPGSSALFGIDGLIAGTVGGGIVEKRVEKLAEEAISSKQSGHFRFNLANEITCIEEAICGGEINVLIDANPANTLSVFESIRNSIENRIKGVLITMVTRYTKESVLINRYWFNESHKPALPEEFLEKINPVMNNMLSEGNGSEYKEMELTIPGEEPSSFFYLESIFPPPKLVIAGAGHIGKALAHLANRLDFDVTVVDDRPEYANATNIPEADHIIVKDIGVALKEIKKNRDTYVVIVTRGHKDDSSALRSIIGTDLAYIGMIGSRTKITTMRENFIKNGWATQDQWDTIHSPVGLEIKSKTVEEIAVSIAAELILLRNSK